MNEQFKENSEQRIADGAAPENNTAAGAPSYVYTPDSQMWKNDPVMRKRKIKQGYGWASLSMILQYLFVNIVSVIATVAVSSAKTAEFMAANPDAAYEELMAFSSQLGQDIMSDMMFLLIATTIGYLVANISSTFIASGTLRAFKVREFFGKIKVPAGSVLLAALAILGIQAISVFVQNLFIMLTGVTGVNETTSALLSFSDNMTANILLVLYTVIIAPITEELLMRGFVLNALSPVNKTFGIIASSLLFGLMHGNFNQIFNGFLLGLLLAYIAVKSGSVKAAIICHMAANANAMFCSAFYEYYLFNAKGEQISVTAEMIHFGVLLVIGIIAAAVLIKRHGRVTENDRIVKDYSFDLEEAEAGRLTWKLLLTRPSFWIITAIYVFTAVTSITAVA